MFLSISETAVDVRGRVETSENVTSGLVVRLLKRGLDLGDKL